MMSACYRLVLDSVCRSNHHRIAVLALQHLENDNSELWRNLFLHNRTKYLDGAKAPDAVFKDFKNHVLHVRDGDWGGAPQAAREWYRRTVRALEAGDWPHAAYCAGVMSHYAVDPVQPFHTGQTEEESVIHRAVEWSFSKSFPELFLILEQDLGWPDVRAPEGDDWLERMIRSGALVSNQHYETVIDHYDFEAGRKKPEAGLDQELKDVVAALIGYASVMLSRILDRAFAESKAVPPQVSLVMDTIGVVMTAPARAVLKQIENNAERTLVGKQYAEYRQTGKVRATLSDDDKAVRALHAEEVLKINISSLDCQWPRETGTANGQGAEPRRTKKLKTSKTQSVAEDDALDLDVVAESAPAPVTVAAPKPAVRIVKPEPVAAAPASPAAIIKPAPKPEPAPVAADAEPASAPRIRIRLSREASVVDAPSIGPKTAGRLSVIGVKTVGDLLALTPEEAAQRIKASHINARIIRGWQTQALLACTVPDLSGTAAQLLVGAGIDSIDDLADADADFLRDAIMMFAASSDGERALRGQEPPDHDRVSAWIASAQDVQAGRNAA